MSRSEEVRHADIDLAQRCLEGEEEAVTKLQANCNPYLAHVLYEYKASPSEVEELLAQLWADCLAGTATHPPLLQVYNGTASISTWLTAILLNRWFSLKRRQATHEKAVTSIKTTNESLSLDLEPAADVDRDLIATLERALRQAFTDCNAEEIILLQLVHMHQITQRELAGIWGCHESQVSRRLRSVEEKVAATTMANLRQIDPFLQLDWRDFLRLCESANLLRL